MSATLGQIGGRDAVSVHECAAIRSLVRDGRSTGEVAFMLERGKETINRHNSGECSCPPVAPIAGDRRD